MMEKSMVIDGHTVQYTLRMSARARNLRLSVHQDGRVVLTVPKRHSGSELESFLRKSEPWLGRQMKRVEKSKNHPVLPGGKRQFDAHKEMALRLAEEKVRHWNEIMKLEYNGISVRNQKTRWGSCSGKRNLNFNFRIVFLPPAQVDYIVVHELAHLKHFNHSHLFWNLVESAIPDYKAVRKQLRTYRFS